jgi:undecaprenyl-diphosphatase
MFNNLVTFDQLITKNIYWLLPRNILMNNIFIGLSFIGNYVLIWFIFLGILLVFTKKINRKNILIAFFLTLFFSAVISNYVLKYSFHRTRPLNNMRIAQTLDEKIEGFDCPDDYSFPSGHATTSFASATILAYFDKKRKYLFFTVAFLISYSRIYLGAHYFFDIIGGALLGYIIAKLVTSNIKSQKLKIKISTTPRQVRK